MKVTKTELAERIESNVPEPLKSLPQWVLWKYQQLPGKDKPKKPPFQVSGRTAAVDDPGTWSSYRQTMAALEAGSSYQGIGFMLQGGIVVIDLDNCLTKIQGVRRITRAARRIFDLAHSYTEVSPSGKGLHIFLCGSLPAMNGEGQDGMRYGNCEIYEGKRYITVTGECIGEEREIREDQEAINRIYDLLKPPERVLERPQPEQRRYSLTNGDEEVLSKAKNARNGDKFNSLYQGGIAGYQSKSEAHLALIAILVYWTNGDKGQVERLFKSSNMYLLDEEIQEKWDKRHSSDGKTYGQMTIEKAIRTTRQL